MSSPTLDAASFVSERVDGTQIGRFARRIKAEEAPYVRLKNRNAIATTTGLVQQKRYLQAPDFGPFSCSTNSTSLLLQATVNLPIASS
jgi:hypothetical protein